MRLWLCTTLIALAPVYTSAALACGDQSICGSQAEKVLGWIREKKGQLSDRGLIGYMEPKYRLREDFCPGYVLGDNVMRDPFSCMVWQRESCMSDLEAMGLNYTAQFEVLSAGKCLCKNRCNLMEHFSDEGEYHGITNSILVDGACDREVPPAGEMEKEALGTFLRCLSTDDDCMAIFQNLYARQTTLCKTHLDDWCKSYAFGSGKCWNMPNIVTNSPGAFIEMGKDKDAYAADSQQQKEAESLQGASFIQTEEVKKRPSSMHELRGRTAQATLQRTQAGKNSGESLAQRPADDQEDVDDDVVNPDEDHFSANNYPEEAYPQDVISSSRQAVAREEAEEGKYIDDYSFPSKSPPETEDEQFAQLPRNRLVRSERENAMPQQQGPLAYTSPYRPQMPQYFSTLGGDRPRMMQPPQDVPPIYQGMPLNNFGAETRSFYSPIEQYRAGIIPGTIEQQYPPAIPAVAPVPIEQYRPVFPGTPQYAMYPPEFGQIGASNAGFGGFAPPTSLAQQTSALADAPNTVSQGTGLNNGVPVVDGALRSADNKGSPPIANLNQSLPKANASEQTTKSASAVAAAQASPDASEPTPAAQKEVKSSPQLSHPGPSTEDADFARNMRRFVREQRRALTELQSKQSEILDEDALEEAVRQRQTRKAHHHRSIHLNRGEDDDEGIETEQDDRKSARNAASNSGGDAARREADRSKGKTSTDSMAAALVDLLSRYGDAALMNMQP